MRGWEARSCRDCRASLKSAVSVSVVPSALMLVVMFWGRRIGTLNRYSFWVGVAFAGMFARRSSRDQCGIIRAIAGHPARRLIPSRFGAPRAVSSRR